MIKIGDALPDATLYESTTFGEACPAKPGSFSVAEAARGKKIVVFGVPGAFTSTCSAKHLPGYLQHLGDLLARGVDEVWCVAVNDGYVMAAWGQQHDAIGKIRMLGDGAAEWALKLGVERTLPDLGLRMWRFSMLVDDGIVKQINVEPPGQFEVSTAETMLTQLG